MTPKILLWINNNKLLMFCAIAALFLLISTVMLAAVHSKCNGPKQWVTEPNMTDMTEDIPKNYSFKPVNYRLPRHAVPTNYKLLLHPNAVNKTFDGSVSIQMMVTQPCKKITLHSKYLTIKSVNFKDSRENDLRVVRMTLVRDKREQLYVTLQDPVPRGNYSLHINFQGRLDKGLVGFYSSSQKNVKAMVASKFQPTYARQAFPCFDEPDFKATYDITLVKPTTHVALSNMNEISKTLDKERGTEAVTFATSVPMSTYLACFVVCDFHYKETEINANGIGRNFKLRSFAQKDEIFKIDFAQDIGKRATEYYIKYYEVPFPLPKLDMIAIPDYVSGATEHWGLITYRETSFLIDEATASSKNKMSVANTIAHELAHMWFGNLVTMKWWDEIWLNEGFATYMQVKALNAIEPSWTMLDQFLTKTLHSVLVTDAKESSHPIVQTVTTPDQITAIFDIISYNKGSSILRMLEGFIGEENFRKGVSDYLKKYEFGNTITQDLLVSLEPYFKKDNPTLNLAYIMDTWTRQKGYPMLSVSKGDKPNTYVITQKRFLLDPDAPTKNDSDYNYRWYVPITYKTKNGPNNHILWFEDKAENVKLSLRAEDSWVKINNNQVGYYRVNYPLDVWNTLTDRLKNKDPQLTISDRAHLLDDVFALAEARVVPYDLALDLTTYLTVEEDYVPWETAASTLLELAERLRNTMAYDDLLKYIQNLISPLYKKQTWEKTRIGVIEGLLRTRILSLATRAQLPAAMAKAREMFLNWLRKQGTPDVTTIEPDLRDFVYKYGMKTATLEEWEKLWQIYLKEGDVHEANKLRMALAAPTDVSLLKKYLLLAWDEKYIRSQDYLNVLQYISHNPSGTALVWDDVRVRWPELVARFTLNSRYLGGLIPAITARFNTKLKLKEMEAFFEEYPEAGAGEGARRRALENVQNNIRWADTHQQPVANWLKQHQA